MKKHPNYKLFLKDKQQTDFAIKQHVKFLRDKLDMVDKFLEEFPEGTQVGMLSQYLIGASSSIPLIIQELNRIPYYYEAWRPDSKSYDLPEGEQ